MNHTFALVMFAALSVFTASVAHAETPTTTDDTFTPWQERQQFREEQREERRALFEQNATERQEFREERREEMQARFDEARIDRIERMLDMMSTRFTWAIERLENIADRIETRIAKIEDETDEDLADAKASLASARDHIEAAADALAAIDASDLFVDEGTADEKFLGIRNAFAAVKTEIKAAWTDLRSTLDVVKGLRLGTPTDAQ